MNIKIIQPSEEFLNERNVLSWPVWQKEISKFPWTYDSQEECYILEGEIIVRTATETVRVVPGDFVTFPAGLSCEWEILKPVRKHYHFS
jgi:uncharacterized protein